MADITETYLRCSENQYYLRITANGVEGIKEQEKDEFTRIKIIPAGGDAVRLQGKTSGKYVGVECDNVTLFDAEDDECIFIREDTTKGLKLKTRGAGGKYLVLQHDGTVTVATYPDATDGAVDSNNSSKFTYPDTAQRSGIHWAEIQ